jgi:hypothetical protein
MAPLPRALVVPSDSMRPVTIAAPAPVAATVNPPPSDSTGMASLPLALLQPSDSVRTADTRPVLASAEPGANPDSGSIANAAAAAVLADAARSTEAQPSTVLVEA